MTEISGLRSLPGTSSPDGSGSESVSETISYPRLFLPDPSPSVDRVVPDEELRNELERLRQENQEFREMLQADFWSREQAEFREQTQMICALANLQSVIRDLRRCWADCEKADPRTQVSLAVLQGLAEPLVMREVTPRIVAFLNRHLSLVRASRSDPVALENEAMALGLPVCHPEEHVLETRANFGIVEAIHGDQARVILLKEIDNSVMDDRIVPKIWLPLAYQEDGRGVAWVERRYRSGVKGRFEPASTRGDDEPS